MIPDNNFMKMQFKPRKFTGFLIGIVMGISIFGLLSFTNGTSVFGFGDTVSTISASEANAYVKNYQLSVESSSNVIKGFTIDKTQLEAMNLIASENASLSGFRIYYGKDNLSKQVGIVVGVDNQGKDAVNLSIYSTSAALSNPCPPVCDSESAILRD
jgi:hypothetical protein